MNGRYFAFTMVLFAAACGCIAGARLPVDGVQQHADLILKLGAALLWLASILAVWGLYRTGGFRHSRMGRIFLLLIACYCIYAMARIQHWSWALWIALVPVFATPVVYCIWFFQKPVKRPSDFLKMAWVCLHSLLVWRLLTGADLALGNGLPFAHFLVLLAACITTYVDRRRGWAAGAGARVPGR